MSAYSFLRPGLFCLDPEQAHNLALGSMDRAHALGLLSHFVPKPVIDPTGYSAVCLWVIGLGWLQA
jgi:dihydroorotate dehydrogenase